MKLNPGVPVSRRAPHRERLAVTYRDVRHLRPDPANARVHSAKQIKQIASSIDRFGFLAPILTDETESLVIAGHGRLQAAIQLGLREVPTISVKHLTEAQQSAYRIADNQISLNATWDDRLLGEQLLALSLADLDFELTVTGFDTAQIDLLINGLDTAASGPDPDDASLNFEPAVSEMGDLWQLGPHRVMCADALDRRSYEALMPDEEAAVVFADAPYNTRVSAVSGKGKRKYREFAMASGEMNRREFTDFLRSAFYQMVDRSRDGAIHFLCMDFRNMAALLDASDGVYSELKNLVVWAKNNGGMGSLYRSRHELIFVFKSGTAAHQNNVELGRFGRNRTNVWEYASTNAFGRSSEEGELTTEHPTSKPVAMIADALLDVSSRGDIVLDPFLGSGSTLMAAERVGRVARGMDLDERYVDLSIRRWERRTGRSAVHLGLQLTYAEVRELRSEGRHE